MDFVWKPSVETVLRYILTFSGLLSHGPIMFWGMSILQKTSFLCNFWVPPNNGQQWTQMGKNGLQWATMDNNGQQSAVLHASLMPFLYFDFRWMCSFLSYYIPMQVLGKGHFVQFISSNAHLCTFQKQFIEETSIHASKLFIWTNHAWNFWKIQIGNMEIC